MMMKKIAWALMHLAMLAVVCAIGAYWAIRILTPAPASAPPPQPAAALRQPDPVLAARMFGLVQAAPVQAAVDIQALGAFAAGRDSAAILAVDGKPPRVYLLNQEVVAGIRLVEVRKEAVTIEQGGVRRDLALPTPQVASIGGAPPPAGFRREGNTLTAPSVAATGQTATAPRPLQPRPPVVQQPLPQPVVPQPQPAQPEQPDASGESPGAADRRVVRGRAITQ
jgi:general secretion pathway protein C